MLSYIPELRLLHPPLAASLNCIILLLRLALEQAILAEFNTASSSLFMRLCPRPPLSARPRPHSAHPQRNHQVGLVQSQENHKSQTLSLFYRPNRQSCLRLRMVAILPHRALPHRQMDTLQDTLQHHQ